MKDLTLDLLPDERFSRPAGSEVGRSGDGSAPGAEEKFLSQMKQRRAEDQFLKVLLTQTQPEPPAETTAEGGRPGVEIRAFELDSQGGSTPLTGQRSLDDGEDAVLLLDLGGDEVLLVAGAAMRRLPRGSGGQELLSRAAAGAAAWRRERLRQARRARLPEQLMTFSERLARAELEVDVCRTLAEHAPRIVDGFTALVFLPESDERMLRMVEIPGLPYDARPLRISRLPRLSRPGTITAADARADIGSPLLGLAPLFPDLGAAVLAHVPFAGSGLLVLVERRKDRAFGPEDWDLLDTLSRQATAALERVRLFEEVRNLSLADPLTGLANRRQMNVVLDRALAAARRGEGLAVVMFDLNDFKVVNDEHGHLFGDRILIGVAEVLSQEARGADLVVRYGGDEFLAVLPGSNAAGASVFVRRVHERLAGRIGFSAGIAEYAPHIQTAEELIEAADRNLYSSKSRR